MKSLALLLALVLSAQSAEHPLASPDAQIARQAIAIAIEKGPAALKELRMLARSDDPRLRVRANEAIGKITGQYGSSLDLIWKRSLAEAVNQEKPVLMLQLFGNFDEEFC